MNSAEKAAKLMAALLPVPQAGVGELPDSVLRLAAVMAMADGTLSLPTLSAARGVLSLESCEDPTCARPLLPSFSGRGAWLENHLFAQQVEGGLSLVTFFTDAALAEASAYADSAGLTHPTPTPASVLAELATLDSTKLASVSADDTWLALAGWHYSGAHKHEKLALPQRESYLARDTSQGNRFAFSSASYFNALAQKPGVLALVDLTPAP